MVFAFWLDKRGKDVHSILLTLYIVLSLVAAEGKNLHRQDFLKVCGWEILDRPCLHEQGVFELCFKKQHEGAW